jgi:hypothetical protein
MTEDMENQVVPGGDPGQATPAASPGTTPAASAIEVDKLVEALLPSIDQAVERKLQSSKDKRIAGLFGKMDDFEAKLARMGELQQAGLSQDDALWRMKVEEALAQQTPATPGGRPPSGAPTPQAASVEATAVLTAMGLDPNSADVVAVLRETSDFTTQVARFAGLAQKARQQQAPPANPATVQVTGSGTSAALDDLESIDRQLAAMRQQPSYSLDRHKYDELYKKRMELVKSK